MNIRCFERVHTDNDQPFRGRTHVIKESSGNRRSRSSRTNSFTESLLLRQRSQSTPLAQCAYSMRFLVVEDPNTIINNDCSSDDPQVKKSCASLHEAVENILSDQWNENSLKQKDTASEVSDLSIVDGNTELKKFPPVPNLVPNLVPNFVPNSVPNPVPNVDFKNVMPYSETSKCDELPGDKNSQEQLVSGDRYCESGIENKLVIKTDDEDGGNESVLERSKHCSINDRLKTSKNDGENISEHSKDWTSLPTISDTVIPFDDVSQRKEVCGDLPVYRCDRRSNEPTESRLTEDQEIDLNSAENQKDFEKQPSVTPRVKEVATMGENRRSNESSTEPLSKPDNIQGDDERTNVSNVYPLHDPSDETELRSPSVKEKIMFFNSG